MLQNLTKENFMVRHDDGPTHRDGNTPDMLFSDNSDLVHSSHQPIICCRIITDSNPKLSTNRIQVTRKKRKLKTKIQPPSQVTHHFAISTSSVTKSSGNPSTMHWAITTGCETSNNVPKMLWWKKMCAICLATLRDYVPPRGKAQSTDNKILRRRSILMRTRRHINVQLSKAPLEETRQALRKRLMGIEKKLQYSYHSQTAAREKKAVDNIQQNPKISSHMQNASQKSRLVWLIWLMPPRLWL